jgi:hypothetical protein
VPARSIAGNIIPPPAAWFSLRQTDFGRAAWRAVAGIRLASSYMPELKAIDRSARHHAILARGVAYTAPIRSASGCRSAVAEIAGDLVAGAFLAGLAADRGHRYFVLAPHQECWQHQALSLPPGSGQPIALYPAMPDIASIVSSAAGWWRSWCSFWPAIERGVAACRRRCRRHDLAGLLAASSTVAALPSAAAGGAALALISAMVAVSTGWRRARVAVSGAGDAARHL